MTVTVLNAASPDYHIAARYAVPGDTAYYDYLRADSEARRLYITRGNHVDVLDLDSGKKVGEIGPMTRAHGVAIAREAGHGFVTSGTDDLITMFDLATLAPLKQIKSTGVAPDAIEYDQRSARVYVANHVSGDVTVIDPASGEILGNVKFGPAKLEGLAFDENGRGFVNAEDKSSVFVFDLNTLQPKETWSVAPGEGGTGLAIDIVHHRLFSACGNNKAVVLDSETGKVIATPTIGDDPDGLVFESTTGRVFTSNIDGTLTIIQSEFPDKFTVLQNVTTKRGCRAITLDEKTGRVFTCAPDFGPAPAAVEGGAHPKPPVLPGTFETIGVGAK